MLPSLKAGQDILVWRWFFKPEVGDMVVFKRNSQEMVKRVKKINKNGIFVTGDNTLASTKFGPISQADIIGKVIRVVR